MYSRQRIFTLYLAHLLWIAFVLSAVSCKKETGDDLLPTVQITSPTLGATFYYNGTINIEAVVTDDRQLQSVMVEITDAQNNRYLSSQLFTPTEKYFEVNLAIQCNDLYLSSGSYYVRITANDGENEQIAFREIQIMEAPRIIERIFAVRSNGLTASIDTLHDVSLLPCLDFEGDYRYGDIESRTRHLVASGSSPSSLLSLSLPYFENLSTAFPPSNDELSAFFHDRIGYRFLWGTQSGEIWSTTSSGTQLFSPAATNASITCIARSNEHIIVISGGTESTYIHILRSDNGIVETSIQVDWEVMGAVHLIAEDNRVLLVGNQNGASHFAWLNLVTSAINEVFNFYESSPVRGVYECEGNDFFVVHDVGITRYYNLLNNYTINNSLIPEKIKYDDLENQLWAITPQQLYRLEGTGQSILQTLPASNVVDLWIQYNK